MTFVSRHDMDLIAFHLALQDHGGATIGDALAEELNHRLDVAMVHVEFPG
jgi:hypothetical protein